MTRNKTCKDCGYSGDVNYEELYGPCEENERRPVFKTFIYLYLQPFSEVAACPLCRSRRYVIQQTIRENESSLSLHQVPYKGEMNHRDSQEGAGIPGVSVKGTG